MWVMRSLDPPEKTRVFGMTPGANFKLQESEKKKNLPEPK
jgi:hypothetical protein